MNKRRGYDFFLFSCHHNPEAGFQLSMEFWEYEIRSKFRNMEDDNVQEGSEEIFGCLLHKR